MNTVDAHRWWALGAMSLAVLGAGLDATVLSLALPTLAGALHASETALQWFIAGYALVLAAAMLPAGLLGDRYGRKKVMLAALVLFGAGSIACAYAPNAGAFIAARSVLGLAGAGLITMCLSSLTVLFTEQERPRAVGVWSMANFLALPIGPILGGWLLSHYWWGWVFLINVPVVLVTLVAVVALVPESRSVAPPGIDPLGVLSSSAGLAAVTYGLIAAGQQGWGTAAALVPLAAGALVLIAFGLWQRRLGRRPGGQPLVDLSLFRSRSFTWGTILAAVGVLAMYGVLFTMPQYFQAIDGVDAQVAGLRLLPLIAGLVVGAAGADRLAVRGGAKLTVALGFLLLALGMGIGATTSMPSGSAFAAAWMALCGAGMGLALATASSGALVELSTERSGIGSAVLQAVNKLGGPFGAAILGSVLNSTYQARLGPAGLPATAARAARASVFAGVAAGRQLGSATLVSAVRGAFVAGMDASLVVATGFALTGLILALIFLPQRCDATGAAGAEGVDLGNEVVVQG
jgi:DHA2 family multidrug resistance protein-like MFS transporter